MEINFYFSPVAVALVVFSSNIWNISGEGGHLNTAATSIKPAPVYPYQTDGFNSSGVKSGPILIIDKKTLFISNINYNASQRANFLVGTGSLSSSKGTLIPDEDNSYADLRPYIGRNIYLQLPGNLTTGEIDYLAVWSKGEERSLGDVFLYANASDDVRKNVPEALGFHKKTENNQTIFRVPKCCGLNEYIKNHTCSPSSGEVKIEYKVFESNETHIDPDNYMKNIEFVPYVYDIKCSKSEYKLPFSSTTTWATFGLLYNSSFIYGSDTDHGIASHGQFCMENLEGNETIFVKCDSDETEDTPGEASVSMPHLYVPLLSISMCCFILSILCYVVILKAKTVDQKCFIGYASSMTITFLCLILLQTVPSAYNFIGSLFFFSILCSISWLACLCLDLIFIIKYGGEVPYAKRLYYYIGFCLSIPMIFLIASIAPDGIPDVPSSFIKTNTDDESIVSEREGINPYLLFVPIILLILASLASLCYTSYLINSKNDSRDYDWVVNKANFKFTFTQYVMIYVITTFSIGVEFLLNVIELPETPRGFLISLIIIEYMQGIFVFLVISSHSWGRKLMNKKVKQNNDQQLNDNHELRALNA